MSRMPLLLLAINNHKYGLACEKKLKVHGFDVVLSEANGECVASRILRYYPDIIIMEHVMPYMNATQIIEFSKKKLIDTPVFIVVGDMEEKMLEPEVVTSGAISYIKKPYSMNKLCEEAVNVGKSRNLQISGNSDTELQLRASLYLNLIFQKIKMPLNQHGAIYLKYSVINSVFEPQLLMGVTKILYPAIARKYQVTVSSVESCMRKTIACLWRNGDAKALIKYFHDPLTGNLPQKPPSNLEFITAISCAVSIEIGYAELTIQQDQMIF